MDANKAEADLPSGSGRRIFSDVIRASLADTPEYKYNLKMLHETLGVGKDQLLAAYASGEIVVLQALCRWLESTFPEDCRTAIIRHGQDRLAEEIASLNANITQLIAQLQLVTKHK